MGSRLAPGNLQYVRLAFGSNQCIDGRLSLGHGLVFETRSTVGITQWARQIAVVCNLKNGNTGMLFVFGA